MCVMTVFIRWTGPLDWTTGLDYWTGLLDWTTGLNFRRFAQLINNSLLWS